MMHYRLIAFPFCLLSLSAAGVFERISLDFNFARSNASRLVLGLALGLISFLLYPSFLSMHPVFGREERTLDHGISDAPWHRYHPALAFTSARKVEDSKRLAEYAHMQPEHSAVSMEVFCATIFSRAMIRYVHGYGLTEPILARVNALEQRPGHKADLVPLGSQLARLRTWDPRTQPGIAGRAVRAHHAPEWIAKNLDTISGIESRMYNNHRFIENVGLALENVGRIDVQASTLLP
jgi:hypothetical protein